MDRNFNALSFLMERRKNFMAKMDKNLPDYLQASANLDFIDSMNSRGRLVSVFFKLKNELKKGEINFFPQE
jgi:hypothetical protein